MAPSQSQPPRHGDNPDVQGQDREPPTHHPTPDRGTDSHVARRVLHQRSARDMSQVPPPHSHMPSPLFSDHPSGEAGAALGWPGNSALTGTSTRARAVTKPPQGASTSLPHPTHHPAGITTLPLHLLLLKRLAAGANNYHPKSGSRTT